MVNKLLRANCTVHIHPSNYQLHIHPSTYQTADSYKAGEYRAASRVFIRGEHDLENVLCLVYLANFLLSDLLLPICLLPFECISQRLSFFHSGSVSVRAPVHLCTCAPVHLCTCAPVHLCTCAPVFLYFTDTIVLKSYIIINLISPYGHVAVYRPVVGAVVTRACVCPQMLIANGSPSGGSGGSGGGGSGREGSQCAAELSGWPHNMNSYVDSVVPLKTPQTANGGVQHHPSLQPPNAPSAAVSFFARYVILVILLVIRTLARYKS